MQRSLVNGENIHLDLSRLNGSLTAYAVSFEVGHYENVTTQRTRQGTCTSVTINDTVGSQCSQITENITTEQIVWHGQQLVAGENIIRLFSVDKPADMALDWNVRVDDVPVGRETAVFDTRDKGWAVWGAITSGNEWVFNVTNSWGGNVNFFGHIMLNSSRINMSNITSDAHDVYFQVYNTTTDSWHNIDFVIPLKNATHLYVTFYDNYSGFGNGETKIYGLRYGGTGNYSGTQREFSQVPGLQAYYPFDDNITRDYSGNNRDLTLTGCASVAVYTIFGSGMYCGTASYGQTANVALSIDNATMIAYWKYVSNTDPNGNKNFFWGLDGTAAVYLDQHTSVGEFDGIGATSQGVLISDNPTSEKLAIGIRNRNVNLSAYVNGTIQGGSIVAANEQISGNYSIMVDRHCYSGGCRSVENIYQDEFYFLTTAPIDRNAFAAMFWASYNQSIYQQQPADAYAAESEGRNAIVAGLDASEIASSYTVVYDEKLHVRNSSGSQRANTFDLIVESGTKRWAFNYQPSSTNFTTFQNLTPVLYVWQRSHLFPEPITSDVSSFINSTN